MENFGKECTVHIFGTTTKERATCQIKVFPPFSPSFPFIIPWNALLLGLFRAIASSFEIKIVFDV